MASSRQDIINAYPKAEPIVDNIIDLAKKLGVPDPGWLANLINFESGFSSSIVNPSSDATGLIQFMPSTAAGLGTSTAALRQMSPKQQWPYVEEYFLKKKRQKKPFKGPTDLYMAVFYPVAMGKGPDFSIADHYARDKGAQPGSSAYQSRFDYIKKINLGIETAGDYTRWANSKAKLPTGLEGLGVQVWPKVLGASILLLGLGIYIYMEEPEWAKPLWE